MGNRMRFHGLLPIGSVVRIGDVKKRLLIIGRVQRKAGEEDLHDYCSVPFPRSTGIYVVREILSILT